MICTQYVCTYTVLHTHTFTATLTSAIRAYIYSPISNKLNTYTYKHIYNICTCTMYVVCGGIHINTVYHCGNNNKCHMRYRCIHSLHTTLSTYYTVLQYCIIHYTVYCYTTTAAAAAVVVVVVAVIIQSLPICHLYSHRAAF